MMNKEDPQIQAVLRHQTAKALHSIPKEAVAYLTEAGTKDLITNDLPKSATWKAKKLKLKYKDDVNKLVNITRAANWKSPGPDKLPNFWIKQFTSLHTPIAKAYSRIMQDPSLTPEWLVEGTTNLLPKKEETWIPQELQANCMSANNFHDPNFSNYRQIV